MKTSRETLLYAFEGFELDAQHGRLSRSGEPIELPTKVLETLLYLVEHPAELLDKAELMRAVWPSVIVEENNLNQAISTLRRVLGERPGENRFIMTVPGRGYRFVATVHTYESPRSQDLDIPKSGRRQTDIARVVRWRPAVSRYLAISIIVAISLIGFVRYLRPGSAPSLPNSIAVLPLENLSPQENSFYADGMHVEIITELSKLSNLNVIVRESVLLYAKDAPPLSQIAEQLNVQSIMTGSFQYADGQIQVTVQLVDPDTSTPLWSRQYNEDFSDIFEVQADIAMNVANALSVEFSPAEQNAIAARPTSSSAAYAAYLRSETLQETTGRSQLVLDELNEALRLDPRFALAHARKAEWYANALVTVFGADAAAPSEWAELERLVRESADAALDLDADMWLAHVALGIMHKNRWRWTDANREFAMAMQAMPSNAVMPVDFAFNSEDWAPLIQSQRRAVALNPNSGIQHGILGLHYASFGNGVAAAEELRTAVDLMPSNSVLRMALAHAEARLGNDKAALAELRAAEELPGFLRTSMSLALLAYVYAQIDKPDDAKRLFDMLAERHPDRRLHAGTWALAHLAVGDLESAREALELVVTKIANEEPDAGYIALKYIRWNITDDPVLDRPPFTELRAQLRGH